MQDHQELYEATLQEYQKVEINNLSRNAAIVEATGYCIWTRLEEIIEFGWRANFKKLGLAFCIGLRKEARQVVKIFSEAGFAVSSVACKTGAAAKEHLGIADSQKVRPGQFEPMCNPVAQAKLLNEAETQLNILLGLCVGHDTLFIRYSTAPVTVLAVKDRVLAHNPLGVLYAENYFAGKLAGHQKPAVETEEEMEVPERILEAVQKAAPDGRLTCPAARQLAIKLGVQPRTVGTACDRLRIKLKACELGCF
jgi:uncharacterized metal-binding protein